MLWSTQTQSARMSILYITAGALIDVWTATYYFMILRPEAAAHPDAPPGNSVFWVAGFFFTGLVLLVIGILVGQIGRAAGKAEVAPATTGPLATAPNPQPLAAEATIPSGAHLQQSVPVQSVAPVA